MGFLEVSHAARRCGMLKVMETAMLIIFALGLSTLLVHEMDAIKHREWRMFIGLRSLEEATAYRVFVLIHLPLYVIVFVLLLSSHAIIGFFLVDVFLIIHGILHIFFKGKANNSFNGFSYFLIYGGSICGCIHLLYILSGISLLSFG